MLAVEEDFRNILSKELSSRLRRNPRYSLRSFARDLGISSGRLSEILNKRAGISSTKARQIASRLNLSKEEAEIFYALVEKANARQPLRRLAAEKRLDVLKKSFQYKMIDLETFRVISDWYHFAILELTYISDFKSDSRWIAKRLGISEHETQLAIERLLKLGLLLKEKNRLKDANAHLATPSEIPSESIKQYHSQILEKAISSLYTQTVDRRDITANTVAIAKKDLPKAKKMIRDFRRRFNRQMRESSQREDVYCLSLQFFSLLESREDSSL